MKIINNNVSESNNDNISDINTELPTSSIKDQKTTSFLSNINSPLSKWILKIT